MATQKTRKKTVTLYAPQGTKVTVAEDAVKTYTDRGYTKTAPTATK